MKKLSLFVLGLMVFSASATLLTTQVAAQTNLHRSHDSSAKKTEGATSNTRAAAAFERIKTLVGDWEARDGTAYGGKPIRVSYKSVSGGTSLMETYYQVGADYIDMVTLYHLDGDILMLTHFCDVNNQVRMRAEPLTTEAKSLKFNYLDATNLSISNKEVINKLEITFQDKDHFTQTWIWRMTDDKGKTFDDKAVYNFVRRK